MCLTKVSINCIWSSLRRGNLNSRPSPDQIFAVVEFGLNCENKLGCNISGNACDATLLVESNPVDCSSLLMLCKVYSIFWFTSNR